MTGQPLRAMHQVVGRTEKLNVSDQLDQLMQIHGAKSRTELCVKLGVSKNAVRNWELAGEIPDRFRRRIRKPVQIIAALAVLRDQQLSDADARAAALTFLEQLEAVHA